MRDDQTPLELLEGWIDESYRAVAPKRMVAELGARRGQHADHDRSPSVTTKP
jgi:hypothetical protein